MKFNCTKYAEKTKETLATYHLISPSKDCRKFSIPQPQNLAIENKGQKNIATAKAGFKSDYCTVPVMEHVTRSYFIVMN